MKQKITKDMTLGEVVVKYPGTIEVFMKYGLPCAGCHVAAYETVEEGARAHGFDDKKLKKLLEDLNKVAKKKKDNSAFDEKELDELSVYDEENGDERSTQRGKTRHTPYKRGGGQRSRKK